MSLPRDSQPLPYAPHESLRHPRRLRIVAAAGVAMGCAGLATNVLVAAAMGKQLSKQWGGVRGVSPLPIEPWLMTTAAEATLSAALAVYIAVVGITTLRRPGRGPILHRWYAWMKLPLSFVFGVWTGWG